MRCFVKMIVLLLAAGYSTPVRAIDQIQLHGSKDIVRGQILEISPTEVKIDKNRIEDTIAVNEINYIVFDREPSELTKGRKLALDGKYSDALEMLKTVKRDEITGANKPQVDQDVDFYTAYCTTQLALGGVVPVADGGGLMQAFFKNNKSNYHYLESAELMGDLLVAFGVEAQRGADKTKQASAPQLFNNAMNCYKIAGQAPWSGADVGLNLKRGRALLVQKKTDEALKAFQSVIDGAAGPKAQELKLAATLGKAQALAANNQAEEGIKLVDGVIKSTPKTNMDLLAQAYLALGACHRAAKMPHDAVLDYLRVDLVYSQNPQAHAEALAALAQLWLSLSRPDRARDAAARLSNRYPNSIWAR